MSDESPGTRRSFIRAPLATPLEVSRHGTAYPSTDAALPEESLFPDWRERLARNLSRRSDGRWDPLTYVHEARRDSVGDE